ncbi:CopG family transcriptional regulator [Acidiphilium multivorum]|nr:CopG family transcriptional regulator [Acidiphilium multivorum]
MSIGDVKKAKKGRPPVDSEAVTVRMERPQIARLDDWRRNQSDLPTRPEAVRRLLDKAMGSEDRGMPEDG